MTTLTQDPRQHTSPPTAPSRVWRVVRLNLVSKRAVVWTPALVMLAILVINAAIWWIIAASTAPADRAESLQNTQYSGGSFYIFAFMMVLAIQVITATFPFALGLSVTRRDFFVGSSLTFVLLAAAYAVGFGLLSLVEQATGGWFVGGHLFTSIYFGTTVGQRMLVVFFGLLFCFFIGAVGATLFMRWRVNGLLVGGLILAALMVGAVALVSLTHSWVGVGRGFVDAGPLGVAAWLLIPTAVAAVAGFAVLRRATPKS